MASTDKTVKITISAEEYKALMTFKEATMPDDVDDNLYYRQLFFKGCEWLSTELNRVFTSEVDEQEAKKEGEKILSENPVEEELPDATN